MHAEKNTVNQLPLGNVLVDVAGLALEPAERRRLNHPSCAGVILFARNYDNGDQLQALCADIKALRNPPLMIAVDQEGGRVQRFKNGFTRIPAMRQIGLAWDVMPEEGRRAARAAGYVIGAELAQCGIDFSFAPVLDIDHGISSVIGDRAFHSSAQAVTDLARAFITGLRECGMVAIGKHFPGHGAIETDSHLDTAVDSRRLEEIEQQDLQPFVELCRSDLDGVMPAHVMYPQVDSQPAGFSSVWLQTILRDRIGFRGIIFSDDLSMHGASTAGDAPSRALAALGAGCDVVLVCNAPEDADAVLDAVGRSAKVAAKGISALYRTPTDSDVQLADSRYQEARETIAKLDTGAHDRVA